MNIFKSFFSKKEEIEIVNNTENVQFTEETKPIEKIEHEENKFEPNRIDWLINDSILTFLPRELYMHYWDSNTEKNLQDPSWQNQGIFFWDYNEPFEKKSLPEFFENFEKKLFVFNKFPEYISLVSAKAIPWFGMPGEGDKLSLRYNDNPITLEEAYKLNIINYVEMITLNYENLSILNDRDNYYFLIDPNEVKFENQLFYLNGEKISLAELYKQKKLSVVKLK
ncbi:hypothetical protein IR010_08300 [Flavobacterium sp. MR2016-29]|uniref:hypothetical protein n=1 Tax=Flavobacterium sp. MR2016-29 TaxID=2783795 RepID=UPI00188D3185|nr:hypothetical protein [Flavobacterium sp. MR2016-29]MBF4492542.1 hypothetical protein [Flavobacterium sp. MR2016-29]